jgi:23S rRNA (adenine2503-C2)-methyltransferase
MNVYVNLIPYNETNYNKYKKSSKERILAFYDILKKHNINVTIRKEFGLGIDAACGQLRAKEGE